MYPTNLDVPSYKGKFMADEANDELESENQPVEETEQTTPVEETAADAETEDTDKLKESNRRLFERAKKAEAEAKLLKAERLKAEEKAKLPAKTPEPVKGIGAMSQEDFYAVLKAEVPQEDINDVREYAALRNITVAEALKTNVVKTILSDKAEARNVEQAANVTSTKRGSGKVSDETLLERARKGELPDSDEDLTRLTRARKGLK